MGFEPMHVLPSKSLANSPLEPLEYLSIYKIDNDWIRTRGHNLYLLRLLPSGFVREQEIEEFTPNQSY